MAQTDFTNKISVILDRAFLRFVSCPTKMEPFDYL